MLSNKTLFALLLIVIDAIPKMSASKSQGTTNTDALTQSPSLVQPTPPIKRQKLAPRRKKTTPKLQDESSVLEAVKAEGESAGIENNLQQQLVPVVNEEFDALMRQGEYAKIEELGRNMNDVEFLQQICLTMTKPEHFRGLAKHLESRKMVSDFLVQGNIEVVKQAIITEFKGKIIHFTECNPIFEAMALSLNEGRHDRFMDLLGAAHDRYPTQFDFECFVEKFFIKLAIEKNDLPIKQFLTLQGGQFAEKYPKVIGIFFQEFAACMRRLVSNYPEMTILKDWLGQPSSMTPAVFTKGFLHRASYKDRDTFLGCDWGEAVAECFRWKYSDKSQTLWLGIKFKFKEEFTTDYPLSDRVRKSGMRSKDEQALEEAWAKENAPMLSKKLGKLAPDLLPTVLLTIVSEYAIEEIPKDWPPSNYALSFILMRFKTKEELEKDWIKNNTPIVVKKLEDIVPLPTVILGVVLEYSPITWIQT